MTAQPHDALFKAAFEHHGHAGALIVCLHPDLALQFDRETMTGEPTSFIDPALAGHHTDLLFSVRLTEQRTQIYLLLEHQSTVDHDMALRVLVYKGRVWERHRVRHRTGPLPLVVAFVITNATGGWTGPRSFHDLCAPHPMLIPGLTERIPQFTLHIEELSKRNNEELASWALAAFPKAALFALRDARDPDKLLRDFDHWGPFVAEASRAPKGMDSVAQLMRYIALASPNLNLQDFRAKIRQYLPKAEAELMTIYEQARQEGRQEGHLEGRASTLAELLTMKFGELPSEYAARLRAATVEDMRRYQERFMSVDSLAAVFAEPC